MNYLLAFSLFIFAPNTNAQVSAAVIDLPASQVFYRGIDNLVDVKVVNLQSKSVTLSGTGVQIWHKDSSEWRVRPIGRSKNVMLSVSYVDADSTIEIGRKYFKVRNLPAPLLYWGGKKESTMVDNQARTLTAKYPNEIPIEASFTVERWTLYYGNEKISGTGSDLTGADEFLKSVGHGKPLTVKATVLGPDGIMRRITGCWFVN